MSGETISVGETRQEVDRTPQETEKLMQWKPENVTRKKNTVFLYFTVLTGQLLTVSTGIYSSWTSPVLPKLSSNSTEVNPLGRPITPEETSLMVGVANIVGTVGCFLLPKLTDIIGRKRFFQIMSTLSIVSAASLACSYRVMHLVLFDSFTKFFLCGIHGAFHLYITELCEIHNRAQFGCFYGIFLQVGHLYSYVVGPFFSFRNFTLMTVLPPLIFLLLSFFIPESPFYLLAKSREEDCLKSLRKLRSNKSSAELKLDLVEIEKTLEQTKVKGSLLGLLKTKETRIGLMLGLLPCVVLHLCGVSAIMYYMEPIFNSTGIQFSGSTLAILTALVKIIFSIFTSLVVEKFGRKRMLLISSVGTGLSHFFLGLFFFLKQAQSPFVAHLEWLPVVSVISVLVMYCLGLGPVPFAIMNESFPSHYRAIACSIVTGVTNSLMMSVTASFPLITAYFGMQYCFWTFSVICFVGAVTMHVFLYDTKGMSLNEIQEKLKNYKWIFDR